MPRYSTPHKYKLKLNDNDEWDIMAPNGVIIHRSIEESIGRIRVSTLNTQFKKRRAGNLSSLLSHGKVKQEEEKTS